MVTLTGCSISLGSFPPVKTINANQRGDWGSWGDDLPSGLDLTSGECESLARQFAWSVRFSMNDQGLISEAWADWVVGCCLVCTFCCCCVCFCSICSVCCWCFCSI